MQSSIPSTKDVAEQESELKASPIDNIIAGLTQDKQQEIQQLTKAYLEYADLWEFRYLNLFLAPATQRVLDWLIAYNGPITAHLYDSTWLPIIPSSNERANIFNALQGHHLIIFSQPTSIIEVTQKGLKYQQWRGALSSPPAESPVGRSTEAS